MAADLDVISQCAYDSLSLVNKSFKIAADHDELGHFAYREILRLKSINLRCSVKCKSMVSLVKSLRHILVEGELESKVAAVSE